jgi:putative phosphoribosyl transferase
MVRLFGAAPVDRVRQHAYLLDDTRAAFDPLLERSGQSSHSTQEAPMFPNADLTVPDDPKGVVLFAHGSGSSRNSPRNRYVAGVLNEAGLATLLIDLLTPDEDVVESRFDIGLLADRLTTATDRLADHDDLRHLKVGYFGASTGGGAALVAAAKRRQVVGAVVSRGGRPDLAGAALPNVRAPTLLIVGGDDRPVIEMNRAALAELRCEKRLEIVPGATHLFEEPGTLEEVARLARTWFELYLAPGRGEHDGPASRAPSHAHSDSLAL